MSERTLTVAEAAKATGLTEKAIRRRIERGALASLLGPDRKRRIPASALGLNGASADNGKGAGASSLNGAGAPHRGGVGALPTSDLIDRLERLARENGSLRQIEVVASQNLDELIVARARISELEAQLAVRVARRRWWRK